MAISLEPKLTKNFLLTIPQVKFIHQQAVQKEITESEYIRQLIKKEMKP